MVSPLAGYSLLWPILMQVPVIAVALIACFMVLGNRERLGRSFPFALLGFGITVGIYIFFPLLNALLPHLFANEVRVYLPYMRLISFAQGLFHAIALGLLAAAVVMDRGSKRDE